MPFDSKLVDQIGIKPTTSSLRTTRSSQLSYTPRGTPHDSPEPAARPTRESPPADRAGATDTLASVFADLLAQPGVTEELTIGSRVGFLAFHGGSLERMTDVIAREAAARSGASYYGVLLPEGLHWHIPSKLVDPAASPRLAGFLDHVDVARARAANAAEATDLMALGVVTHTRFDAAGEAAS